MSSPRVLLTGASGFVGRAVLAELEARGIETHCLGRTPVEDPHRFHAADLLEPGSWQPAVAAIAPTHLLHLAWVVEHGKFWAAPENLDWTAASLHLFRSAAMAGCGRILGAGTSAEYAWDRDVLPEDARIAPNSLYGTAKAATSDVLAAWGKQAGISTAWARLFFLYGAGEAAGRFVPAVARGLLTGGDVPCGHGHQIRDFLAVEDAASGLVTALLADDLTGPFNLSSGEGVSLRTVAETLASQVLGGIERLKFGAIEVAPNDPPSLIGPSDRLRAIGWTPQLSLADGLARTLEYWRDRP